MRRFRLFPSVEAPPPKDAFVTVAASDTPSPLREAADYKCAGVGDETVINEALNNHTVVILLPGTFVVSGSIVIPSGRRLIGSGKDATTIRLSDNHGSDINIIVSVDTSNISLEDLTVDGGASGVNKNGVRFIDSRNVRVKGVRIRNVRQVYHDEWESWGVGLFIERLRLLPIMRIDIEDVEVIGALGAGGGEVPRFPETWYGVLVYSDVQGLIRNVRVHRTFVGGAKNGIYIRNTSIAIISQSLIGGPEIGQETGIGLSGCSEGIVSGNIVAYMGHGILLDYGSYNVVEGNVTEGCGVGIRLLYERYSSAHNNTVLRSMGEGIVLDSCDGCVVKGNTVVASSQARNNTFDNILVRSCSYCLISGNVCRSGEMMNRPRFGIRIEGGMNNVVEGNVLYDAGASGDLSDAGTNTRRRDNISRTGAWLADA